MTLSAIFGIVGRMGTMTRNFGQTLVDDDREAGMFRVNRAALTSEEVLAEERRLIFEKCWIYIGHESEIPNPNDYVRRNVLGRPIIFIKGADGVVRVFYNVCPHRGAQVCRQDQGNGKRFTCFYHSWTFTSSGDLVTLPDAEGYGPGFERSEHGLTPVPRFESYRGFWFLNYDVNAISLLKYLGEACDYIDLIVDQSESGSMRVLPGCNKHVIKANWKLIIENSSDAYHALPLHQTYWAYTKVLGGGLQTDDVVHILPRHLGNGHVIMEGDAPYGRPIARWDPIYGEDAKAPIEATRARLVEKWGEEHARRMSDTFRNLLIFPNLILNDITAITIRYFEPESSTSMRIHAWALAPIEEQDKEIERRVDSFTVFIGPAGFAMPDDIEALESCQLGYGAQAGAPWNDISRGMARVPESLDELQMRIFWRAWAAYMDGVPIPEVTEYPETPVPVAALSAHGS